MAELELDAMASVLAVMEPLDQSAQSRVIGWVSEKLGLRSVSVAGPALKGPFRQ